jgi:hypothetical protein
MGVHASIPPAAGGKTRFGQQPVQPRRTAAGIQEKAEGKAPAFFVGIVFFPGKG